MPRGLSNAQLTAVVGTHRIVVPLFELFFDSGTLRLAICPWDVVVSGNTYNTTGQILSVKPLSESSTSKEGAEITMSGLDAAIINIAAYESYRGRFVRLSKLYLDKDTNAQIGNPVTQFIGRMQSIAIAESNNDCAVTLTAEHYEIELTRPAPLRLNNADQQRLYPGDKGCDQVESMTEKNIVWPALEALKQ